MARKSNETTTIRDQSPCRFNCCTVAARTTACVSPYTRRRLGGILIINNGTCLISAVSRTGDADGYCHCERGTLRGLDVHKYFHRDHESWPLKRPWTCIVVHIGPYTLRRNWDKWSRRVTVALKLCLSRLSSSSSFVISERHAEVYCPVVTSLSALLATTFFSFTKPLTDSAVNQSTRMR